MPIKAEDKIDRSKVINFTLSNLPNDQKLINKIEYPEKSGNNFYFYTKRKFF